MNISIMAGTFDPFTLGHYDVARRAASMFDKVIVGVADTGERKAAPIDVRLEIARKSLAGLKNVEVRPFTGFLTDFAAQCGARILVRGLRTYNDFEYEKALYEVYKSQNPDIETIYIMTAGVCSHISGSIVRELAHLGGSLEGYVTASATELVRKHYGKRG